MLFCDSVKSAYLILRQPSKVDILLLSALLQTKELRCKKGK